MFLQETFELAVIISIFSAQAHRKFNICFLLLLWQYSALLTDVCKKLVFLFIAVRKSLTHFPRIIIFQIIPSRRAAFSWQDYSQVLVRT
jgi:hypothetical protein